MPPEIIERILRMFSTRCTVMGLTTREEHLIVLKSVLLNYQQVAGKSEAEILAMVEAGELTEGAAVFWLGIDWLTLREKVHGSSPDPG